MRTAGPEKNRMVAAHRPSRAAVGAAGCQVSGGGVVHPVPTIDRSPAQDDREHGLANTGRAYEQHVGRVSQIGACCELSDEFLVDAGLGGEDA